MLQRAQYGTRSEKLRIDPLDDDQVAFAFEKLRTGLGEIEAKREKLSGQAAPHPSRPRKGFAPHLERIEEVFEPDVSAECEGREAVRIGEDVTERHSLPRTKAPLLGARWGHPEARLPSSSWIENSIFCRSEREAG